MTTTVDAGLEAGKIEAFRSLFHYGNKSMIKNLAATPDDKLNWKPSASAKSVLQIAAHVAATNDFFIKSFQGSPPETEFPAIFKWIDGHAEGWTTREVVTAELNRSSQELDDFFGKVTPDCFEGGNPPIALWVSAFHAIGHSAQIDYLQTCWGDMAYHMVEG